MAIVNFSSASPRLLVLQMLWDLVEICVLWECVMNIIIQYVCCGRSLRLTGKIASTSEKKSYGNNLQGKSYWHVNHSLLRCNPQ